jgi:hypothetical protein
MKDRETKSKSALELIPNANKEEKKEDFKHQTARF